MAIQLSTANFPLGLVPQKRPPRVPKSFIKCRVNTTLFLGDLWGPFLVNQPKWKSHWKHYLFHRLGPSTLTMGNIQFNGYWTRGRMLQCWSQSSFGWKESLGPKLAGNPACRLLGHDFTFSLFWNLCHLL